MVCRIFNRSLRRRLRGMGIPLDYLIFCALLTAAMVSTPAHAHPAILVTEIRPAATVHQTGDVESTAIVEPWRWHTKLTLDSVYITGREKRLIQSRYTMGLGFGLPHQLALNIALPVGYTFKHFRQNGDTGFGPGDLRTGVLYQIKDAQNGGVGILLGSFLFIPTGRNTISMGEGALAVEPFMALSLTSFSTSLTVNFGYHFREERHVILRNERPFEQDDALIWRVSLRIPKEEDIAWSLMASGTIGMATGDGLWPRANNRPVWLGGSIDFPSLRDHRMGLICLFLLNGPESGVYLGMQWSGIAKDRDEDRDGILLPDDKCPLLREDFDGYQDEDGCPDLDNDMDSFPDTEDACPLKKGDEFSTDGC